MYYTIIILTARCWCVRHFHGLKSFVSIFSFRFDIFPFVCIRLPFPVWSAAGPGFSKLHQEFRKQLSPVQSCGCYLTILPRASHTHTHTHWFKSSELSYTDRAFGPHRRPKTEGARLWCCLGRQLTRLWVGSREDVDDPREIPCGLRWKCMQSNDV